MTRHSTLVTLLKACTEEKNLGQGIVLHADILKHGLLENNPCIGNSLIYMYAKCGDLRKASQLLEDLPVRDVASWNALISGFIHQELFYDALCCFEKMQWEGFSPNFITFICILKACGNLRALEKGKQVHSYLDKALLKKHIMLGNALVDMYAKCDDLVKARKVLEELPVRNAVSWSTLIARYAQIGEGHEALICFKKMRLEGLFPDIVTYINILQACGSIGSVTEEGWIHDEIIGKGMLQKSIVLGNAIIGMYVKCGVLAKAHQVLEEIYDRDVITWSTIIMGYALHGRGHEALSCFQLMQREGLIPNQVTFIGILKACGSIGALDKGKQIHDEIVSRGMLERNIAIGNALVDMYVKCSALGKARKVLEVIPFQDIISWNSLISGYAQNDQAREALNCFVHVRQKGISPNEVSYTCILKACGNVGDITMGEKIHDEIIDKGLLQKNIVLGTALVNMYAKCGVVGKAQKVFDDLSSRDIVSWNALIAGYAQQRYSHEVFNCLASMQREGLVPDEISYNCILKACGSSGAIVKGKRFHNEILNGGFLENNIVLGNALVDMYAKCGALENSQQVLEGLSIRDNVTWASLIAGYAQEGLSNAALNCFEQMQKEGLYPNDAVLLSVLNACSHSGKSDEAQIYYEKMSKVYGLTPKLEHHTCMVMVFASAGRFDKAMLVIKSMPYFDDPSVWLALLGSCQKWRNVKLGRLAFDKAIQLDSHVTGAYVLMANIYAAAGMREEAEKVESMRVKNTAWKGPEISVWVDRNGCMHTFPLRERNHLQIKTIYAKMEEIFRKMSDSGYCKNTTRNSFHESSECLAISCALLSAHKAEVIDILSNTYVSNESHKMILFFSKIEQQKIVVRALNCVHIFESGKCSCNVVL